MHIDVQPVGGQRISIGLGDALPSSNQCEGAAGSFIRRTAAPKHSRRPERCARELPLHRPRHSIARARSQVFVTWLTVMAAKPTAGFGTGGTTLLPSIPAMATATALRANPSANLTTGEGGRVHVDIQLTGEQRVHLVGSQRHRHLPRPNDRVRAALDEVDDDRPSVPAMPLRNMRHCRSDASERDTVCHCAIHQIECELSGARRARVCSGKHFGGADGDVDHGRSAPSP